MEFRWHYADGTGAGVPGPELSFADQTTAEDWLSANWPDLLDGGIDEVTLTVTAGDGEDGGDGGEGERTVYGPMSLRPPPG